MITPDESQLISEAIAGKETACRALIRRYEPIAFRTAIGMLGNTLDAEDIAQEALISFFRNLSTFRGDSSLTTWITRITLNLAIDELRKQKKWWQLIASDESTIESLSLDQEPSNTIEKRIADASEIEKPLDSLKPEYRAIIHFRLIEGYSTSEVSKLLEIPEGTVLSRLSRARRILAKMIIENQNSGD